MYCLETALLPFPQSVTRTGEDVVIGQIAAPAFSLQLEEWDSPVFTEACNRLQKILSDTCCITCDLPSAPYTLRLGIDPLDARFDGVSKAEAYFIEITEREARLCGKDAAGAFYAVQTFAQLLHTNGNDVCLPPCRILDYPDFARRGNFIECRYGTEFMTKEDWMDAIDYFASMKNNQLTVGVYGCWADQYDGVPAQYLYLPIQKYPELKTPKSIRYYSVKERRWVSHENQLPTMFREDFFGEIVAYGKKKNVTVKPLFNSLGHNRLLPTVFPEISAKKESGEPSGYGFCTRNKRTEEILFDIYDEILDRYLIPNGIDSVQIGMDEVGAPYVCHCPACRDSSHEEIMVEFIIKLCRHLKERGMKHIYVYHDMLYNSFNCVNESLKERFVRAGIYDEVILDWWTYEHPDHLFWDKVEGVNGIFRSTIKPFTGYYHWAIPTDNNENIRACAALATEKGFEGIEAYSSMEYCYDKNYFCLAEAAWNTQKAMDVKSFDRRYAQLRFPNSAAQAEVALEAMRVAMRDETDKSYLNSATHRLEYYYYCYRRPYTVGGTDRNLRPFPEAAFNEHVLADAPKYRAYLQMLAEKAATAVDFFENRSRDVGKFNDVWLLTAKHYQALSDEYLTLWSLYDRTKEGAAENADVLSELDRLILQREKLMALAETVRFPASSFTYLRNMSVFRQFYLELREHVKNGGAFALSLPASPIFGHLR